MKREIIGMTKKKILVTFLLLGLMVILFPMIAFAEPTVTQDQAVQWATSCADNAWEINDGSGYTQCTEFVWAYYEYLIGYHVGGDGCDYATDDYGACPYDLGWTRPDISDARPGDIFVKNTWRPGHVGVIIGRDGDTIYTAEANAEKTNYYSDMAVPNGACASYKRPLYEVNGLIRPAFKNSTPSHTHEYAWYVLSDPTCTEYGRRAGTCACGDIIYQDYGKPWGHNFVNDVCINCGIRIHDQSDNWTTASGSVLPDGDYIIAAMADRHYYLDIDGADSPAAPGTNVHLWYTPDGKVSDCDAWTVRYENGYYRISQRGQNVSLDVDNESAQNGANVQVWINNDFSAQKWTIIGNSSVGYRVKALCSSKSLEYENSILANGTNVQQWADDDVPGQYWMFIPYSNQSDATNTKPVVTLPNVLFEPWNDDRFTYIGETDASIGQRIVVEDGYCTEVGMILYDTDGVQKGSAKNPTYEHEKNYFKINEELGVNLWPGTTYQYKFYAVVDGQTMYGNMGSFTTNPSSHDHSFTWTTAYAPTCVDSGFAVGECVICGFRQIEDLVALGHDYVNGVCTRCGHTLATIGHMHSYNWTTIQEASCTESGYKVGHCALCGDEVTNEVPALGHSYVNGVCTRCGEQQASNSGSVLVKPITPSMFPKDDQGQSPEPHGDTVTITVQPDTQSGYSLPRSDTGNLTVTSNGESTATNKFTMPAGALIRVG